MAVVWIPSLMRDLTGGERQIEIDVEIEAPGQTVGEVLDALDVTYPGIKARLCDGDRLDPAMAVSIDGRIAPLGLLEKVGAQSEIHFVPAVSGG